MSDIVLLGSVSSFALSALFGHLYQEKKKEVLKLKDIPHFKADKSLLQVLRSSRHKRLQYVAVEGVVQAEGEPLASKFVPRCFGVMQNIIEEEHWKYWNNITRTWNSRSKNTKETSNCVPFYLIASGDYATDLRVKVQSPLDASGHPLERIYSRARQSEKDLVNVVLAGISGERPVSMKESEELLRVGTIVTGYGEVVLEGGQVMRLQAPQHDRKYMLIASDHRSFIGRHESSANMWKTLSTVTGLTGASLLAGLIYTLMGKQKDE